MKRAGQFVVYAIDGSSQKGAGRTASRLESILRGLRKRDAAGHIFLEEIFVTRFLCVT